MLYILMALAMAIAQSLSLSVWFIIAFLSRSKSFMAAVTILSDSGTQENKICHCFHFSPSICHEVMGLDAMILVF